MASKEYGGMKIRHKKGALFLGTYITSFSFFFASYIAESARLNISSKVSCLYTLEEIPMSIFESEIIGLNLSNSKSPSA